VTICFTAVVVSIGVPLMNDAPPVPARQIVERARRVSPGRRRSRHAVVEVARAGDETTKL